MDSAHPPHTAALTPNSSASPLTGRTARLALAVVLFAAFMDLLDGTIVVVAAPAIARDLAASDAQLQWMVAAYTLALGSGLITGGRIGDDYGRRRVFLISLAAFTIASAMCALALSPEMLIGTRVLQGLAGGFMVPQVFGIIRSSFCPAARAKAFGAYGAVLSLASVAGPLLGGLLVDADLLGLGWRGIFWVNVPVAAVALLLGVRVLPESTAQHRSRLDLTGSIMVSLAVLLVLLPLVQGRGWGWPWWGWALLAGGLILFAVFLLHERRLGGAGGQPVLDPDLLSIRTFTAGLLASVLFFGAISSFFLSLSIYLQSGTGRSAWQTGLVILPYAIGSIITSGLGIALAARAGRLLLVVGSLLLAASQGLVWFLVRGDEAPGYWLLALALFIGGLGLGLAAPILVNVVLAGVPGRAAGAAGGVLTTVNQIGGAVGVAVLGTLFFSVAGAASQAGQGPLMAFSSALTGIMGWQVACYVVAAALMLLLPQGALQDPG